jgi:polar amino acid transport system substrate-binding protein
MTPAMRIRDGVLVGLVAVALTACTAGVSPSSREATRARELVVGVTSDSPPYATERQGQLTGLEVDLAGEAAKALGRPVRVVDLPWEDLFDQLSTGRIDAVMAGVTITPERELRFAFTEPYLRTRIVALVRRADRRRFASRDAVCKSPIDVGVMGGTMGELYVRERCPAIIARVYRRAPDAVLELRTRRLDAVVHDGPVLAWLLAQDSAGLELVPTGIADQDLAWVVRRDDPALRDALNGALASMRSDGTLERVLRQWVPRVERIRAK